MIELLLIAIISLLPTILLLFYLKRERHRWQKRREQLDKELERQSFRLLETETRLMASHRELEAMETAFKQSESDYIPLPLECRERELSPARGASILIVESSSRTLFLLGELLKLDYNLLYADNCGEAHKKLAGSPRPDLVICPVKSGGIDGVELYKESCTVSEPIPFIFISEGGSELRRITSLKEENLDFINRLSLQRELRERVANRLALRKLFDELYHYKAGRRVEYLFDNYCKKLCIKGKQKEVARLIMNRPESTNLGLGDELAIAQNTLRTHIKRIGAKMGLPGQKKEISRHLRTLCYEKNYKVKGEL